MVSVRICERSEVIKRIIRWFAIVVALVIAAFILYLLLWPVKIDPAAWTPPQAPPASGVYAAYDHFTRMEKLLEGYFAPESVAIDKDGIVYTGLIGVSNGGAAAVGAAAEESAIRAMVLESTFADINPLIEEQWENETILPKFFLPGVVLMNKIINGYDLSMIQPIEDIKLFAP